ncbi:MAG: MFS transporter, partial [Chloroflexota bacterium]
MIDETRPSYRALLAVPGLPRLVASMVFARVGWQMLSLVLVLFAHERYGSPAIAGVATFFAIAPGLGASPIAGALLDRHGRTRLIVVDYLIGAGSLFLIALLAAADALPVPVLLVVVTVASLTSPLSNAGVRTLFPVLVPAPLWERANAIDSNGYVVASIFGPALAGLIVATLGAPAALVAIGVIFVGAAVAALGLRDPSTRTAERALLPEAWRGLVYVLRNPSLRALALGVSLANIGWGLFFIALPVLVLQRLGGDAAYVGTLFALLGLTGSVAVLVMGRIATRGRE